MKQVDPYDRSAIEVRILSHLNDSGHPLTWEDLVGGMRQDSREAVVWKAIDLKDEGLLEIRSLKDGQLISITAQGKEILLGIYSGRGRCH